LGGVNSHQFAVRQLAGRIAFERLLAMVYGL
jgi:hypothetical protein